MMRKRVSSYTLVPTAPLRSISDPPKLSASARETRPRLERIGQLLEARAGDQVVLARILQPEAISPHRRHLPLDTELECVAVTIVGGGDLVAVALGVEAYRGVHAAAAEIVADLQEVEIEGLAHGDDGLGAAVEVKSATLLDAKGVRGIHLLRTAGEDQGAVLADLALGVDGEQRRVVVQSFAGGLGLTRGQGERGPGAGRRPGQEVLVDIVVAEGHVVVVARLALRRGELQVLPRTQVVTEGKISARDGGIERRFLVVLDLVEPVRMKRERDPMGCV